MKKYAFLVPVAVAVGALAGSAATNASMPSAEGAGAHPLSANRLNKSANRVDSFVLTRSESGVLLAQHESHYSHESHSSHASHASHESHASHYSSFSHA
jgi:hypothetical protein